MGFDPLSIFKSGVEGLLGGATRLIDEVVTSDEEKRELKIKMEQALGARVTAIVNLATNLFQAQRDVLVAEAKGESAIQRLWRPITMLSFVAIIVNNYIVVPYVKAFGGAVPTLEIPPGMWALLNVGIGGYIASRGVEKVFKLRNGGP